MIQPSISTIYQHRHDCLLAKALLALGTLEVTLAAVHSPQMCLATRFKQSKFTIDQHRHDCLVAKALLALGTLIIALAAVHGPQMPLATAVAIESNKIERT